MLGTPEWGGVIYGGKNLAESLKGLLNNEGTSTTDTESIPTMAGCRNTSGLGKVVPLILGKTRYTPSFIGNPFHTISGADGETETFHALYNLGYKDVQVKNVSLDIYDVANNDELVESGNLSINPDSIYNENDYKTKIVLDKTGGYYDFNGQLQWNGGYQQRVVEEERNVELICEETDLDGNTKSLAVPFFSEKYPHRMEVEIQFNGLLQYNDEGEEEETEVELELKMSKDGGSTYQSIRNGGFFVNTNTDGNVKFETSTTSTSNITKIKGKKNKVLRYVCPMAFTWEDVKDVKNNRLEFIIQRKNYTPKEKNARNQVYLKRVRTWCYNRKESLAQNKMIVQFPITEKLKNKIKTLSFSISTGKQEAYNVLDKLNVELTSKARIWNSTTKEWSTDYHPTNNIASIVLMLLQHDCRGKKIVSDERIDLESFGRFYEFCEKKKLYCNGAVSKESKTIDILNELLVIGRGIFVLNGNKYAIAIDDVQENPVMVLNSQNILSISHSKAFEEKIDGYQATFVNALNDYQEDEIIVADADLSDENTILERVTVNYVTDPAQVQKYLYYKLANRRLRNEKSQIRLSVDGYLIEVGNLVLVQEESLSVGIGKGAEIKRVVTDGEYITGVYVDANFNTTDTSKEYGIEVNITLPDNYNGDRVVTYKLKNLNVVSNYLEFDTPIHLDSAVYPQVGDIISFGIYGNITTKRLCVSKKENGDGTFDLDFIPYQEGVYTADEGEIPEFISNVSSVKETSSASLSSAVPTVTLEELNKRLETVNVLTVNSIKEQYYSSTSRTEVIGGKWVETPPQSEDGKYIWTKSIFIYSDGTSTETSPVSVSGESGYGIESIDMEYALNQDSTTPPTDGWSTIAPLYNPNYFIWTRTKTKIQNSDDYKYTDPVCINGIKGDKGDKGDTGPKGDTGAQGAQGPKGDTGPQGAQGATGAQGPKGDNYWLKSEWIDLSASTYDVETWFPVVGSTIYNNGVQEIKVSVQLNSGTKPSWSTHPLGFSVDFHVQDQASGWGTTPAVCLKYIDTFSWTKATTKTANLSPVSYTQMTNSSVPVLYLRGGGKYFVSTTYACSWSVKTITYTVSNQSVAPSVSARPTPRGTYIKGEKGDKGDKGLQGATGPKGEDSLGFAVKLNVSDLSTTANGTIFVSGYENSVQANVNGYVRYLGNKISVTKTALKPSNQFVGWIAIPATGGTPVLAYRTVAGQWKSISNGTSTNITGSNYVAIAEAKFESSIKATASSVIEPIRLDVLGGNIRSIYYGKASSNPSFSTGLVIGHFYLNTSNGNIYSFNGVAWEVNNATDLEMQCMTDLLEIAQSSSTIGTPTFINKLVAYRAFIDKLLSKEVTIDASTFGFIKSTDFATANDSWVTQIPLPSKGFGIIAGSDNGYASSMGAEIVRSLNSYAKEGYIRNLYTNVINNDGLINANIINVSDSVALNNVESDKTSANLPTTYISTLSAGRNYKPTSGHIETGSLKIGDGMADGLKYINASSTTFDSAALILGAMGSKTIGVGIIASSYSTSSGYVKFANGLIIQWIKEFNSTADQTWVPLPISFSTLNYCIVDGRQGLNNQDVTGWYSKEKTRFSVNPKNSHITDFICIGY